MSGAIDLIYLNQLLAWATPGKHEAMATAGNVETSVFVGGERVAKFRSAADAKLYAELRNVLPDILCRLERLSERNEQLSGQVFRRGHF